MRACALAVLMTALVSSAALAQQGIPGSTLARSGSTGVVLADAPIFLLPDANRVPLRVAARGTTLTVVQDGKEWIQVEFRDPEYGTRQGYIQAKFVQRDSLQPMDLSVSGAKPAVTPAAERAADRRQPQEQQPLPSRPVIAPGRTPLQRGGFWFSGGLGFGALTCEFCENSYFGGLSGGLAAGGTVNPHLLIGAGTTGWARTIEGDTVSAGTLDFRVRVYPSLYHGFFVNGGIGFGSMSIGTFSDTGLGGMYGLGWDIRTGRNISVTPFWNGSILSAFDQLWGFGQIGVGVTFH